MTHKRWTFTVAQSHLGPRLFRIMEACGQGKRIIDVGCDHAQVPLTLLALGLFDYAIASDIHKDPLDKAAAKLKADIQIGLWPKDIIQRIEFRQCDGLAPGEPEANDVVVIAGMGGYEMIDILLSVKHHISNSARFVLAPQKSLAELRLMLARWGATDTLSVVVQDNRTYPILQVTNINHEANNMDPDLSYLYPTLGDYPEMFLSRQMQQWTYDTMAAKRYALQQYASGKPQQSTHVSRIHLYDYLLQHTKED